MSSQAVVFKDVSKSYGERRVLSGINLTVSKGEYLGLIGVNGAGKTTLIKSMLDLTLPESGSIAIFEASSATTNARSRLAYLPERFTPPYYLTGRDFLDYMARLYQRSYEPDEIEHILTILDLDFSALKRSVRVFSKGMSQKLGLAACLLSNKELLVMDEPMSGLDPKARAFLKQHLAELKKIGKTVFFSTHLLTDVESLCDRVAVLHEGQIRFVGSPAECCRYFQTDNFEEAYLSCVGA